MAKPKSSPDEEIVSRSVAARLLGRHLTDAPLYLPLEVTYVAGDAPLDWPSQLIVRCSECGGEDTPWARFGVPPVVMRGATTGPPGLPSAGPPRPPPAYARPRPQDPPVEERIQFACSTCSSRVTFWILREDHASAEQLGTAVDETLPQRWRRVRVKKVGQWPPASTRIPKSLEKVLTASSKHLYQRARACLVESYGIGAVAYMRRLLEDAMGELLQMLEDAALANSDDVSVAQIKQARTSLTAAERLKIAAEHAPRALTVDGTNPLRVLYGAFSEGIHGATDEEATQTARELLAAFDFAYRTLREHAQHRKAFAADMRKRS
jgi:hypothetical protein